jgi:3-hydroxyisobutyrate dehydrogenase
MKLAVNTPLSIYFQALGEALAVARSASIEPQRLLEIFAESSGGANVLKTRAPMIADVLAGGLLREATGFDLDSARKDVRTILAEAKRRGLEMPLLERTLEEFNEASQRGWGPRDTWAHAVYWALGRRPIEPGSEPIRVADDAVSDHTHG